MKWVTPIGLIIIAVAALISILFVAALKPTSNGAFLFFGAWLTAPYVMMSAVLIFLQRKKADSFYCDVVAVLVCTGGILYLADVIFWHPDAQGAAAVLMTPLLQGIAFASLLPVALWISRNAHP